MPRDEYNEHDLARDRFEEEMQRDRHEKTMEKDRYAKTMKVCAIGAIWLAATIMVVATQRTADPIYVCLVATALVCWSF